MNWYLGSIQDAIATSKRRKAYFIVYVEGNDELSNTMTKVLDSPEVSKKFETNNFVAIKLAKDSEGHKQFEAFYKLVPVPSLFFIDQNGSPVEIVVSDKSEETVLNKVNNAIGKCTPQNIVSSNTNVSSSATSLPLIDQPSTSTSNFSSDFIAAEASDSSISAEPSTSSSDGSSSFSPAVAVSPTEKSVQEKIPVQEPSDGNMEDQGKKSGENKKPQESPKSSEMPPAPIEERVEKAKTLIGQKRLEKSLEEMKNEKRAELERRRFGQEMLQAKREQQDRELRQLKEEREREKKEEAMARQRILDQIAQDRADRAQRQSITSRANEGDNPITPRASSVQPRAQAAPPPVVNIARLQFKLPSGETKSHTFTRETTLAQVRQFIDNNIVIPFGSNYQLATTFPRREFTARDNSRDLADLQLIPSAVILIIPTSGNLSVRSSFGWTQMFVDMFWDLASPVISLSRYVCNLIFGRRNGNTPELAGAAASTSSRPSTATTTQSERPSTTTSAASTASSTFSNPALAQRLGGTSTIKKRGNIYSLRENRDDDEDNNTWNGNSTQQM